MTAVPDRDKPELDYPDVLPPSYLDVEDLVDGQGTPVDFGRVVTVRLVGWAFSTGEEFVSTWEDASPMDIPLGSGVLVSGLEEGLLGMRVGGRRRVIVPPSRGFADAGHGAAVRPGETLMYVVDLLAVR